VNLNFEKKAAIGVMPSRIYAFIFLVPPGIGPGDKLKVAAL
jgi:hypothetical protein